jgi:hypothetical protein
MIISFNTLAIALIIPLTIPLVIILAMVLVEGVCWSIGNKMKTKLRSVFLPSADYTTFKNKVRRFMHKVMHICKGHLKIGF